VVEVSVYKLLRGVIGEEFWSLGSYRGILWESDRVRVVGCDKGGNRYISVHDRCGDAWILDVSLGDPDLIDKVRAEIRRLI
jgi:hypothetical protein